MAEGNKVMANERSFQSYFMKVAKPLNYYRIALINGTGFPDLVGFHGAIHSLVELKDFSLGKRGDKKIRSLFKDTQPPFYVEYFKNGGSRLFVSFRITEWDEGNKRYGLWQMTMKDVLCMQDLHYKEMVKSSRYKEYLSCKQMIEDIETWGEES